MFRSLLFLITVVAVLIPTTVFAIGVPDDDYIIKEVVKYPNSIVSGDVLYVVHFDLKYTTTPDEMAIDTFKGILFDDTGDTSSAIVATSIIFSDVNPTKGYNEGVFGIYLEAAYNFLGTEKLCLEPDPSISSLAGKRRCTPSIVTVTTTESFQAWIIETFEELEKEWIGLDAKQYTTFEEDSPIDLIQGTGDSRRVLTRYYGENYAVNSIPKLREILPLIFESGTTETKYNPEVYQTGATDSTSVYGTYFEGTELDTDPTSNSALKNLSESSNIPIQIIGVMTIVLISAAVASMVVMTTGRSEIGMFAAIMVIQVGAYTGLIPFALAAILAMIGALSLGYIFFYKSSTS